MGMGVFWRLDFKYYRGLILIFSKFLGWIGYGKESCTFWALSSLRSRVKSRMNKFWQKRLKRAVICVGSTTACKKHYKIHVYFLQIFQLFLSRIKRQMDREELWSVQSFNERSICLLNTMGKMLKRRLPFVEVTDDLLKPQSEFRWACLSFTAWRGIVR